MFLARSYEQGAIDVIRTTPANERPWDLVARGSVVYLLTSSKTGAGAGEKFTVSVWQSNGDFTGWTKRFSLPGLHTFARSFEEVNGDFYLGLGTDDAMPPSDPPDQSYTSDVKADSGRILFVR